MNDVRPAIASQPRNAYQYFLPKGRLPAEGKIAHFAKEIFTFIFKAGAPAAVFYATATLAKSPHSALMMALFLASVASLYLLKTTSFAAPPIAKVAQLALCVETCILIGWNKDLIWQNRIKLLASALVGGISVLAKTHLAQERPAHLVLGGGDTPLEEMQLNTALLQIAESGRTVKSLELIHSGSLPFILNQKSLELMQCIQPEEIKLTHCILPNQQQRTLDSFNQGMNADPNASKMVFYYFYRADEKSKHYVFAKVKTSPSLCNLVIEKGHFTLQDFHRRFLQQFFHTKEIHWSTKDTVQVIENKNNKGIALDEQTAQEIISLGPIAIKLHNCEITPSALELLNSISAKGFFYDSSLKKVQLADAYQIGLGEKLSCQSIERRLIKVKGSPLKILIINNEGEKVALSQNVLELILSLGAQEVIFKNCMFLFSQLDHMECPASNLDSRPIYRISRKKSIFHLIKVLSPQEEFPINLKRGLSHLAQCQELKLKRGIKFKKLIIKNFCPEFRFDQDLLRALKEIKPLEVVFSKFSYSQPFAESLAALPNCKIVWNLP